MEIITGSMTALITPFKNGKVDLEKYELFVIVFQESNEISELLPQSCQLINLNTKSTKNSLFELIKTIKNV